ncbi:MAG: glutamate synthase subunit beta [Acidobacteria bacterium]|nr:glutamate synthase subunit beta [Acidobacteriota bacterium]
MGKVTGFIEYKRETPPYRPVPERVNDWFEVYQPWPEENVRQQASRCMDCGVPFCHTGCPVNNIIPDWNDLVYQNRWREAIRVLHATNNFPEFTGRICPAPCEAACVLGITDPPVAIKLVEKNIVDHAWKAGWIRPEPADRKTGKRVAVIGSGPAGLAAAQQLARAGHAVTVYEKWDRIGGLLRYGIPDFKMEKHIIDRRLDQMREEGVEFVTNANVGVNVDAQELRRNFNAVLLAGGAEHPRDLNIPGRELKGIHYAMDFLPQQNKRVAGDQVATEGSILATGKNVVIIGGGDTGADCLGTSHRHKAANIVQLEIMQRPPDERSPSTPWPLWPLQFRVESAHDEGDPRVFGVLTRGFEGDAEGNVRKLNVVKVDARFQPIPGSEFAIDADLVLLAMGFTGPVKGGLLEQLDVRIDTKPNGTWSVWASENYMTSQDGVFAAGDVRRGQSLVVWAIHEGRRAARAIDVYLTGSSSLAG